MARGLATACRTAFLVTALRVTRATGTETNQFGDMPGDGFALAIRVGCQSTSSACAA